MRKRAPRPDPSKDGVSAGVRFPSEIKGHLPVEHLAELGAVCLAWNVVEDRVDALLQTGLDISSNIAQHVTSRINGMDGKIAIVKEMLKVFPPAPEFFQEMVSITLAGVSECKGARDGAIHARLYSHTTELAYSAQRQGRMDEIVFTREALNGVYDRLTILDHELRCIRSAYDAYLTGSGYRRYASFIETGGTPPEIFQRHVRGLQEYQATRKFLPPLPTVDSVKASEASSVAESEISDTAAMEQDSEK